MVQQNFACRCRLRPRYRPRPRGFFVFAHGSWQQQRRAGTAEPFRVARPEAVVLGWNKAGPSRRAHLHGTLAESAPEERFGVRRPVAAFRNSAGTTHGQLCCHGCTQRRIGCLRVAASRAASRLARVASDWCERRRVAALQSALRAWFASRSSLSEQRLPTLTCRWPGDRIRPGLPPVLCAAPGSARLRPARSSDQRRRSCRRDTGCEPASPACRT